MKIGLLSVIAAAPLAAETLLLRVLLFIPCWAASAGLAMKWFGDGPSPGSGGCDGPGKIDIPLGRQDRNLRQMIDQLKGVIQQTESASMAINERFMNIAGRAKRQLLTTREIVGAQESCEGSPAGANADVSTILEAVTLETNLLASDINTIVESLQFQDITRQHIEQVIAQIQELLAEIEQIKERAAATKAARQAAGPIGRGGIRMERNRDEGEER